MQGNIKITNGFKFGLLGGLGVLAALVIGGAIATLATIITYVAAALFIALGLDPVIKWFGKRGLSRPLSTTVVTALLLGIITAVVWGIAPTLASQTSHLIELAPTAIDSISKLDLIVRIDAQFNGAVKNALDGAANYLGDSSNWPTMLGGVVQLGINIFNGFFGGLIVLILSIYFMASLQNFKSWMYGFVPQSRRTKFKDIAEQISESIGRYVMGQVVIGLIASVLGYIFMSIMQIPFAIVLSFIAFLLGLIPLVGTITSAIIIVVVALSVSPTTALIAAVYYLVYMQIESYVISPRIMNKAVSVPGSVVVIAALAGGTVLGVLGALVAIPVAAAFILITRQIIFPKQDQA